MQTASVSFRRVFDKEGTVYRKCVRMDIKTFMSFKAAVESEGALTTDTYKRVFLNVPMRKQGLNVFLNITQSEYFIQWADGIYGLKIDMKRLRSGSGNMMFTINP